MASFWLLWLYFTSLTFHDDWMILLVFPSWSDSLFPWSVHFLPSSSEGHYISLLGRSSRLPCHNLSHPVLHTWYPSKVFVGLTVDQLDSGFDPFHSTFYYFKQLVHFLGGRPHTSLSPEELVVSCFNWKASILGSLHICSNR